jgi:hypothetical protein
MFAVLGPFTSRVYVTYHFWTPICNVLGYWRRRWVCYTSLITTPLVVTTISVYSVLWPSDVVVRSSPLISSVICSVISLQRLYLGVSSISVLFSVSLLWLSLLCLFYLCLGCIFRCSGFPTIWLFRKRQIRTRPLSYNFHFWSTAKSVTIYIKVKKVKLSL